MEKIPVSCLPCSLKLGLGREGMTSLSIWEGFWQPGLKQQSPKRTEAFNQVNMYFYLQLANLLTQKYGLKAPEGDSGCFRIVLPLAPLKNCLLSTSGDRLSVAACPVSLQPCLPQCLSSPSSPTSTSILRLLQHVLQNGLRCQMMLPTCNNVGTRWQGRCRCCSPRWRSVKQVCWPLSAYSGYNMLICHLELSAAAVQRSGMQYSENCSSGLENRLGPR